MVPNVLKSAGDISYLAGNLRNMANLSDTKATDVSPDWSMFSNVGSGISALANASNIGEALGAGVSILGNILGAFL